MNYKTIFLETTVACVITGFYIYKFVRYRKSLKQYKNKNKNIKVERFSKTPIILLLVFMLLCLASLYYGCRTSNQSIVEAVIFLICIVAIEIIMIDKKYCLYHTDDTFFANDREISFKEIKTTNENKRIKKGFAVVTTYNHEKFVVCHQTYKWMIEKIDSSKKKQIKNNRNNVIM